MSGHPVTYFPVTMSSGSTLTSAIDLGRSWSQLSIHVPSMASGTDVYLQGAATLDGTYVRIHYPPTLSNAAPTAQYITSAITNCIANFTHTHVQYIKIEHSTAMTATAASYKIIVSDLGP